jgi:peptidylprolyl isomerase
VHRFPLVAGVLTLFFTPVLAAQDSKPAPAPAEAIQAPAGQMPEIKRDAKGVPLDTKLEKTKTGLQYCVLKEGKAGGAKPTNGDMVKVHYSGWLLDGTLFDTSKKRAKAFGFPVGKGMVILGWDEGLKLMTVGSIYKFIIPFEMAYGEQGRPPVIPAKAPLVFEIELVSVTSRPKMQPLDPKLTKATESGMKYQILDAGKGGPIAEGDWVVFKVAFFNLKGELLDWSEDMFQQRGSYPDGPVGKMGLPFLNEAMKLVMPGGKIRCRVPMALSFGSNPPPNLPVGKGEETMWEIEVVERYKPLPVPEFKMSDKGTAKKTESGLLYEVIKEGKEGGKAIAKGSKVKVHYSGWLTSGKLFDASYKRGMPIDLEVDVSPVITAWHEGLKLMKEGAVYRFTIPAALGYGAQGRPPVIPANSTLVFVIEVVSVQ